MGEGIKGDPRKRGEEEMWQPIATAPRVENVRVLVVSKDDIGIGGLYWPVIVSWVEWGPGWWDGEGPHVSENFYTHWMPLPPPPT